MKTFLRRLVSDARGNVAMLFGLSLPVLILMTVGGVDIHRASTVRVNLQDALDAATLAAARSPYSEDEDLREVGLATLRANLKAYPDIILHEEETTFSLNDDAVVVASSKVDVKTLVANIFLPPYGKFMDDYLPVGAHSEVNRSSRNLEVALVLDITGSMSGSRITAMKAAAQDLVDLVVQDVQEPYYTRMSVVPYSIGVNMGSYANGARGAPTQSTSISGASWQVGSTTNISAITRANPGVVTANGHGLANNDYVWISGVKGMTQVNSRIYRVTVVDSNRFQLKNAGTGANWSTSGYSNYSSGGTERECRVSDCSVVVTSNGHGMGNGEGVYITGVSGMSQINNTPFAIANVTANTYSLGVNATSWGNYSSGGQSWCGRDGCQWRVFRNISNNLRAHQISTCVTERTGAQAYTSAAPSTAFVGRNYPATSAPCPSAVIRPLSSDKAAMKSLISSFNVTGSTAGHIGLAWGWYTVSPTFNPLWSGNPAGVASPNELLKAVILMTDGEFNTNYCTGVLASNAGIGGEKINCAATNGSPYDQAEALCDAMKAEGVVVYTVGLELTSGGAAEDVMQYCATSPDHVYLPASGGDLSEAFAAIGRELTQLRISR
ncbi:ubiquitin-activating E1 FCCH domain-containing protein [Brevundimonas sp.]|uniref:ubiquitin-activating E1 FCCH domain-containing protein n=1 Tax=Brevundimonas sp. TaxID=1871086 RepID=UPI003F6F554F